jgi:hypothetical protein
MLVEIWAEAARDAALRTQLAAAYAVGGSAEPVDGLTHLLGIGALVQLLTRPAEPDSRSAAARLGVRRAA